MAFEITGKLIEKFDTRQVSDSFRKREFVLEKKPENSGLDFSDYIKFQLIQDRCDLIDPYQVNDELKVFFNIRGNRWEKDGRVNYFTNLDVWKIEKTPGAGPEPPDMPGSDDIPPLPDEENDLPF
ncbi:MAG: DUF3127 domain-containing protein [Chlorobi bacterium]|nr:DUF3127 domain-containing protein [Chlorobiota bacterium]